MIIIKKIKLLNFKRFQDLTLTFNEDSNTIIGDNESGKSTILLALDLVLSGSRSKIENIGLEFLFNKNEIDAIIRNDNIIKLFYQEHYLYKCKSRNWGDCKGENIFDDVCVVLNKKSLDHYLKDKLKELSPQTKNKLYVAISRAHGNVYFIAEKDLEDYKLKS